jgi:uncharacterized membrane protein YgdD (TMEM256/DUF423 family)
VHSPATQLVSLARSCIAAGALLMLLGVMLGAFGAHGLQGQLTPRQLASYQTGVQYQLWHALGLLLLGLIAQTGRESAQLRWSARLMVTGIVLFSGSIYLLTAGAPRWFGMVAPVGGLSFMAAWALLAWHALSRSVGQLASGATNPSGFCEPPPNRNFSISSTRNLRAFGSIGVRRYSFMSMVWCFSHCCHASFEMFA